MGFSPSQRTEQMDVLRSHMQCDGAVPYTTGFRCNPLGKLDPEGGSRESSRMFETCRHLAVMVFLITGALIASEDIPLHQQIDRLIEAGTSSLAEPCGDATFLRRVTLDFAGRIPKPDEVVAFLADTDPDKRSQVIDHLLNGPEYPVRMAELFHVLLMERRGDDPKWHAWLEQSFKVNKPWDQLVREIVRADYRSEENRSASFFYTKRLEKSGEMPIDYPGLTRDVGRLFLGMDLQCAQCHKHLQVDEYDQEDFQGLFAAYQQLKLTRFEEQSVIEEPLLKEKIEFASVFNQRKKTTGPRIPGLAEIEWVSYTEAEAWEIAPDKTKKILGIPRFSPLTLFAEQMPQSPAFAPNIVNRLWAVLMGRGLVEPLDLHHPDNPPSHPELLDVLSKAFVDQGFNIKWFLRELAMSDTYQRASRFDGEEVSEDRFARAKERGLSAEQLMRSVFLATGNDWQALDEAAAKEWRTAFMEAFANPPKEPELTFSPSVKGSLFMSNDVKLQSLLTPDKHNLVEQLSNATDEAVPEMLFLHVFSRQPDERERSLVAEHLQSSQGRRAKALAELAWALLTATEFVVNH
jgi:hypothetical protein